MKIAVAGTGYVGLVTAVCLAEIGHKVICVDIDENKINLMKSGEPPFYEKDLKKLMNKNKKRITYTTDYKVAYQNSNVIFIGVGTPEKLDGSANLDYVYEVCDKIKESATSDKVVVVKSTVPIGTNDEIEKQMNKDSKFRFYIVSNPEFLSQGTAVHDTLFPSRIVVGIEDDYSQKIMKKLYDPLTKNPYNTSYLSMDRRSAEMVKYASNNFLALKISYINEIANFCEQINANITDVTLGMSYDSRIGNQFLNAGIGYGGSCFPKDTKALHWLSKMYDCEIKTIAATIEVNKNQKLRLFEKFQEDNKNQIKDKTVAVLGLSFKPGTSDLREAPSIDNVKMLLNHGCSVHVYDPIALDEFKRRFNDRNMKYFHNISDAIKDSDAVFIMTELKEIIDYDISNYKKLMKQANIYDGRNCYSMEKIKSIKEINYYSIGRVNRK